MKEFNFGIYYLSLKFLKMGLIILCNFYSGED